MSSAVATRWPETREESWRYFPTRPLADYAVERTSESGFAIVGEVPAGLSVREHIGPFQPYVDIGLDGLTEANHRHARTLVLEVMPSARIPRLEVLHTAPAEGVAHPRLVVVLGRHAELGLVVRFGGAGQAFVNAATELVLRDGARLALAKIQAQGQSTQHVESVRAEVGRDAHLEMFTASFGSRRSRTAPTVVLAESGAAAEVHGLYLGDGDQLMDHTARVVHAAPHTRSKATWAGVLDGHATGTFQGLVHIAPAAVKAETRELTRTLLLSPTAVANAKPELHIDVDDVAASHGATIGALDPAQQFYLAARGIDPETARRMLVQAFVREALSLVHTALREVVKDALDAAIGAGEPDLALEVS